MQFSRKSEYGVRVMTELAAHYGQGPISLSEIARDEELPLPYLEQIVALLRRADLVRSHQGVRGGYELTRQPADISMSDVLEVLEGTIAPMLCAPLDGSQMLCARESFCGSKTLWWKVRDAIAQTLRATSLADLVVASSPAGQPRAGVTPLPMAAGVVGRAQPLEH